MLKVDPTDIRKLPVLDPGQLTDDVMPAMGPLLARAVLPVFQESKREDRKALDDLVMGKALGLTEAEQREVYDAVADLVRTRIERAKSARTSKRGAADVDMEALVRAVEQRVGPDSIAAFYSSQVLPLPGVERSLPHFASDPTIEKTLYCWRVHAGKVEVPCQSRSEARFLRVFAVAGFRSVRVPSDAKSLEAVAARLTELLGQATAAIEDVASQVAQSRLRARLVRSYWSSVREAALAGSEEHGRGQPAQ